MAKRIAVLTFEGFNEPDPFIWRSSPARRGTVSGVETRDIVPAIMSRVVAEVAVPG